MSKTAKTGKLNEPTISDRPLRVRKRGCAFRTTTEARRKDYDALDDVVDLSRRKGEGEKGFFTQPAAREKIDGGRAHSEAREDEFAVT